MSALLCEKVHVPPLDLPKLDLNFNEVPNATDECLFTQKSVAMEDMWDCGGGLYQQ